MENTQTDNQINRLKEDLYDAQSLIIQLMPDPIQKILTSYVLCKSRQETYNWLGQIAEELITFAKPLASEHNPYSSDRAYCPLCGEGSDSPYQSGYSLPEGLRRHLTGSGQVSPCKVIKIIRKLARDSWEESEKRFAEVESREALEHAKLVENRKKNETLYRVSPDREPVFLDEIGYGAVNRNEEEIAWVEQRLIDLGFKIDTQDRVKSYIDECETYVVYADPRLIGQINFRVYKKPISEKNKGFRGYTEADHSFQILDTWKHDLAGKYLKRVEQVFI